MEQKENSRINEGLFGEGVSKAVLKKFPRLRTPTAGESQNDEVDCFLPPHLRLLPPRTTGHGGDQILKSRIRQSPHDPF